MDHRGARHQVYACDDLLGHGLGANYPYSAEVKLQPIFSAAAFAINVDNLSRYGSVLENTNLASLAACYAVLTCVVENSVREPGLRETLRIRPSSKLFSCMSRILT